MGKHLTEILDSDESIYKKSTNNSRERLEGETGLKAYELRDLISGISHQPKKLIPYKTPIIYETD